DENDGPITDAEREFIWDNIRDFGRTKNYNQNVSLAYNVPTRKIPLLDWTQIRASYTGNYTWSAASLNVDSLGNVIQNGSTRQLNGDLDFTKLYNKSKYLKKINSPARNNNSKNSSRGRNGKNEEDAGGGRGRKDSKQNTGLDGKEPDKEDKKKKNKKDAEGQSAEGGKTDKSKDKKEKKNREPSTLERVLIRPLMMVRKARVTYSENLSSVLPGFTPTPRFFGLSDGFSAPGWGYGLGLTQPDSEFLNQAAGNGWITNNIFLNQQVLASRSENYEIRLTIEPFKDFRIELNASRNYSENHSEYFKTPAEGAGFQSLNSFDVGSLNLTFMTLGTLFEPSNVDNISETFQQFEANRTIISQRLGILNPRSNGEHASDGSNFTEGYGRYQQDVLIPAFLAAYSGADAQTYKLDIFDVVPRPNWRLTYNGLNKIKGFDKIFQSFTLSHGYTSTVTVNQFQTDLAFDEQYFELNEQTNNYFSPFEIPDLVISEQLAPLIGIDMRLKNEMTAKVDIKRTRNLALSLTDFQLIETKTNEFTIGFGYRIQGFKLPFAVGPKKTRVLENDLNFKFDFSFRDDKTINHLLDQEQSLPTRGSKTIRISPSIDYAVNQQVNIRIFFDRSRTIPATSASFPITNTQAGVTVRFALTQ
ncbi:MAG: cell surface protein SprA, partial [Bacteroidota bacterium]